jgi:hypothetical protein
VVDPRQELQVHSTFADISKRTIARHFNTRALDVFPPCHPSRDPIRIALRVEVSSSLLLPLSYVVILSEHFARSVFACLSGALARRPERSSSLLLPLSHVVILSECFARSVQDRVRVEGSLFVCKITSPATTLCGCPALRAVRRVASSVFFREASAFGDSPPEPLVPPVPPSNLSS